MKDPVISITVARLAIAFIPVLVVVVLLFRWSIDGKTAVYAIGRMLIQLVLIGHVLAFFFAYASAWLVMIVLAAMLSTASWIALYPVRQKRREVYRKSLIAVSLGGIPVLFIVTQAVLDLEVWYEPRYVIPLAGMIFASSMNGVSIAAERFEAEAQRGLPYNDARNASLHAAMIPLINTLFAVGLVSLPGMMTGQILSGIEPLVAVRYQIMVMCMVFAASGISVGSYLTLIRPKAKNENE